MVDPNPPDKIKPRVLFWLVSKVLGDGNEVKNVFWDKKDRIFSRRVSRSITPLQ